MSLGSRSVKFVKCFQWGVGVFSNLKQVLTSPPQACKLKQFQLCTYYYRYQNNKKERIYLSQSLPLHLNTIGGRWYFGRVLIPQRFINLSLYHEIILLQKFNYISGKVLKPKKISLQPQKKK